MLPAVITALLSLGSTVSAQQPSPLEHCVQDHVHQLLELSDWTVEQKLLNDAERLLGTARRLVPGDSNAGERAEQLRELRTGINRDRQLRDAHQRFWKSRDYDAVLADLRRREARLQAKLVGQYLKLAADVKNDDPTIAEAAFRAAFAIAPKSRALRTGAGSERLTTYLRERPGLEALELGETVVGKPTDVADLQGKVVLWRSFSL